MKGKVLKSVGSWYDILSGSGEILKGRLKGKFKINDKKLTNPISVGDWVEFENEINGENAVVIVSILDRENYLARKSSHKSEHSHIIASNIDEIFLIATLAQPETSLGFIDRFLVAAESFRIKVSIIFNKSDLWDETQNQKYLSLKNIYEHLNYQCFKLSAEKNIGIEVLKQHIKRKTILFGGHSGVGKSTLMNRLFPELNQKTAAISNFAQKGVHTTTFAEMFAFDENTFLIDTPGINEFGLTNINLEVISHYFPEMRDLIGQCKFHNCQHINEPNCKVIEQVKSGNIEMSRYKSYLSMMANEDNRK